MIQSADTEWDLRSHPEEKVSVQTTDCSQCGGKLRLLVANQAYVSAHQCPKCAPPWDESEKISRQIHQLETAEIPASFHDASLKNAPTEFVKWIDAVKLTDNADSVLIVGPTGAGKTYLAIAGLMELWWSDFSVLYLDCAQYLEDKRGALASKDLVDIGGNLRGKTEYLRSALKHRDVVVIDNLGIDCATGWAKQQIEQLIMTRLQTGSPVILCSPLAKDQMQQTLGPRLASRLIKMKTFQLESKSETSISGTQLSSDLADVIDFSIIQNRNISINETTFLHAWSREGIFRLLSKNERADLTACSVVNPNETIELAPSNAPREFISSWSGLHVSMHGPVVDYFDANVLAAIIKIYSECGMGGKVQTSIARILNELQLDTNSGANKNRIKRSLTRLSECRITLRSPDQKESKLMWSGGFINSLMYEGNTKSRKVLLSLNEHMIPLYSKGGFSKINLPLLTSLTAYAQGMYRFLIGQRDEYKFIGLLKWRKILNVSDSLSEKDFRDSLRRALKELVELKILDEKSTLDGETVKTFFRREKDT